MGEIGAIVDGDCEPAFERVRDALAEVLASGFEIGAALAVYVDGDAVVDLWGGHADAARSRPWQRDTIVNLYSVGKAISAVCALRLVDAGLLSLDAPVARYWPEFAQASKARLAVRHLLTHQAALPAIARPLPSGSWSSWTTITEALAAQAPWWEPGAGHGYHVNTQGFLIGEVVRRITGQTLGAYLRDSITRPAGIDFFVGFGPELDARCADVLPIQPSPETAELQRRLSVDVSGLSGLPLMRVNAYRNPPRPRSRRRTATATRAPWLGSTRRWPATASSTASTCSPRRSSRARAWSRCTATTSCSSARRASVSAFSSRWPSAGSVRTQGPSDTSAPGARSDSRTRMRASPSAT